MNGQALSGSPWVVHVLHEYQFAFQFGSTGEAQGVFEVPWEIAVNVKTGTIAVADRENIRIRIISSDGNILTEIRLKTKPASLEFTESGDIIVVCVPHSYNQFSLFTEGGQLIKNMNDKELKKTV